MPFGVWWFNKFVLASCLTKLQILTGIWCWSWTLKKKKKAAPKRWEKWQFESWMYPQLVQILIELNLKTIGLSQIPWASLFKEYIIIFQNSEILIYILPQGSNFQLIAKKKQYQYSSTSLCTYARVHCQSMGFLSPGIWLMMIPFPLVT